MTGGKSNAGTEQKATNPHRVNPGWLIPVVAAGLISAFTFPGQTAGLSPFTDPLILDLHLSRTEISTSYLIGTLLGAVAQPAFGRAIDRWGARRVVVVVTAAFALTLIAVSFAHDITGLTLAFIGLRMTGQGALSLAATTAIARAVHHRRGLALGITSAIGSGGVSVAPIAIEYLLVRTGYQTAWRWEALALILVVIPLALLLPRPRLASTATGSGAAMSVESWTANEAARSGMFWVLAATVATSSMLSTGLAFHQIAILGQQGLSPLAAAANFLPQTITSLLTTLLAGALVDRLPPRVVMCFAMVTLAAAMLMLPLVSTPWSAAAYGLVLGAAGGSLRGIEVATYVRYYGPTHIGAIRGIAIGIAIASSSLGPLALATGHDLTGTFTTPAITLAGLPILMAILALIVPAPGKPLRADGT